MMAIPVLLLVMLELGLRLAGYGYSTAFFAKLKGTDGKQYLINSETFSLRFFPPGLARWPGPFKIPAEKPAGVRRIFIFGESAAMGDPQPSYGASRYLEVLLRERFPKEKFEVVNLGITAINSHVILPIARECVNKQGDIWIIYMGNNEMVGPFGASTVFGLRGSPLWLARLDLAIQNWRVGQLAEATVRKLANLVGKSAGSTSWGGMQMFLQNQVSPTDPRKETVYRNFEANLRDILKAGKDSGAAVILSSVSVNLRDCPPFASFVNSNLPAADQEQFKQLYTEALSFETQSNPIEATRCFEQAAKLQPRFAELQFRWGTCLLQMTNFAAARKHFQTACDDDALPFRTDTRINGTIRRLAKQLASDHLTFCDAETALQEASPVKVAGDESFFEHVHFNFDGNYRLAHVWADKVASVLARNGDSNAVAKVSWATQEECERQLGLSDFNRAYVLQSVIRRMEGPPLNLQFNNPERLKLIEAQEAELQKRMNQPGARTHARELFDYALQKAPNDHYLYEGLGNLLESLGDKVGAIDAYGHSFKLEPQDYYSRMRLGHLMGETGQQAEAAELLAGVVKSRPSLPDGWYELGMVQTSQGEFQAALNSFDRALQLRPQDQSYAYYKMYCEGKWLAKQNRHAEAIEQYRKAIRFLPGNWEAHYELGGELDAAGQLDAARKAFGEAAHLNPGYSRAHFNYGVLLAKLGQLDKAQSEFEETIRLEPDYASAHTYLNQVKMLKAQKQKP